MVELDITTMSSKGQIVIPKELRKGFHEGEKFIIIKADDKIILKRTKDLNIKEDLEFAQRTEEAWRRYDKGEFTEMDSQEFLKEIYKW